MDTIKPMRPLAPLYRPDERFEISAAGLQAWYRSESFKRVADFYASYPSRSILSDNGRALLHHLIVMLRPERVLEIGTMYAGTTEVLARALWESGRGHVETIDPYGAERCPPLIKAFPPKLRERITFSSASSAMHFDHAISRALPYDLVFIDGNHELEYAAFDLECTARLMRPGGLVVLDNIEQPGPRFATKLFLERHADWVDVAGVVCSMDPKVPLLEPQASFPDTKNFLIQAPAHYVVRNIPRSFGALRCDSGEIEGIDIEIGAPAAGELHMQLYVRTFGMLYPEELTRRQVCAVNTEGGCQVRIPLDHALRTEIRDRDGISRRMEVILAFVGDGGLALKSPPKPYPAKYI